MSRTHSISTRRPFGMSRVCRIWGGDMAKSLVFGPNGGAHPKMTSAALRNLEAARQRSSGTHRTCCQYERKLPGTNG